MSTPNRFKFRVWSPSAKKLYDWIDILNDDMPVIFQEDKEYLMQSTGMKDDIGKEIYEGDIVVSKHYHGDRLIIEWDKNTFSFIYRDIATKKYNRIDVRDDVYVQIIGNIYENSELLTK
jgi:uncharacterized phage protein (TIGR01671 family)